jgi:hypothetical protein
VIEIEYFDADLAPLIDATPGHETRAAEDLGRGGVRRLGAGRVGR